MTRTREESDPFSSEPAQPVAEGIVFVLAAGGLRCMNHRGRAFLGYAPEELFWKDALGLVHEDDLLIVRAMISRIKGQPGRSVMVECRMKDAAGYWRVMNASVQNVLEAPTGFDDGLLIMNVTEGL